MKITKLIFLTALTFLIASVVFGRKLPPKEDILPELFANPKQIKITKPAFTLERDKKTYTIEPSYSYEMYGLIASYHHSAAWFDYYHKQWGDDLNKKDIALLWGMNVQDEIYYALKFWNGSWTAYWQSRWGVDRSTWGKFRNDQFSNNHLLVDDPEVYEKVMNARKGDQIYMKGYLSSYTHPEMGFTRKSSMSRTDTGNGACETIFVTEFEILKKGNLLWRKIGGFSKLMLWITFIILIVEFFSVPADLRRA